ncbi:acyltransferase [Priestia aryabhattai]|uniref:acyltransferase n=1 Tax=Priestia aryabhattai TaxID=412384 RepID=UPI001C0B2731|nr:acyltransferase [Priestia aryabhattai]MBU3570697.1 acyltransferase [Priestia aryabhattai]
MRNPFLYGVNLLRICFLKLMYPKKLSIGFLQSFEKIRLELKGDFKVSIGNFNQSREKLYLGVSNGELKIGQHCFFNINCSITCLERIEIGNECKFGNNLVIVDHDHNFKSSSPEFISGSVKIGNNVWVGSNVTILRNSTIGDNCVIAAGSVIKGNVKSDHMVIGNVKNSRLIVNK